MSQFNLMKGIPGVPKVKAIEGLKVFAQDHDVVPDTILVYDEAVPVWLQHANQSRLY